MLVDFISTQSNQHDMQWFFFTVCFCGAYTHIHSDNSTQQIDVKMIYLIFIALDKEAG